MRCSKNISLNYLCFTFRRFQPVIKGSQPSKIWQKLQINFVFHGKSPVWLMVLDMIIVNVFKAESNPRTINRTIYTSFMQIMNAHKLMPFIFTPLWTHVYSIYYFRYKRYGLREFLQKSAKPVRIHKIQAQNLLLSRKGHGPGSPEEIYDSWTMSYRTIFCWLRCSKKQKVPKFVQSFIQSAVRIGMRSPNLQTSHSPAKSWLRFCSRSDKKVKLRVTIAGYSR